MSIIAGLLISGAFGLAAGSFLNVCIYRLPLHRSLVRPRSHCPACKTPIRWFDNVPVVGYLLLAGRCRACRAPIPWMYPVVEGVTAAVFVAAFAQFGPQPLLIPRLLFACAMIVLFVVDLQHRILPNAITLPGIAAGFAFSLLGPPGWLESLLGVACGGGLLLLIAEGYYRIRGEEGLGMGDVKMLAMIGAFLGWRLMFVTLVLSSFLGSVIGLALVALRRGDMKYALPFGSFLAIGALVASVAGRAILDWYLGFY